MFLFCNLLLSSCTTNMEQKNDAPKWLLSPEANIQTPTEIDIQKLETPEVAQLTAVTQRPKCESACVINNGGFVVEYKDLVYYITKQLNYSTKEMAGSLYVMKKDGSEKKVLFPKGSEGCGIYIYEDYLYVSFTEHIIEKVTYKISLDGEEALELFKGAIDFFDSENGIIYSAFKNDKNTSDNGLYKISLENNSRTQLYKGKCRFLKMDGDTIYICAQEQQDDEITIGSMKTDGTNFKAITEDNLLEYMSYFSIMHFDVCGDWLVYSVGSMQGSALNFWGYFVRVKKDGSEKEHVFLTDNYGFTVLDGWIYYNYCQDGHGDNTDPDGYYKVRPDLISEKQYLGGEIGSIVYYDKENDWLYYVSDSCWLEDPTDICRSRLDGSDISTIVSYDSIAKNLALVDSDFIIYNPIDNVGDWLYFNANIWGYPENSGWRPTFVGSRFFRIKLDGTGLQTLEVVNADKK